MSILDDCQLLTSELRSTGPKLVPLLANKCLYQGVHLSSGQLAYISTGLGHQMPLPIIFPCPHHFVQCVVKKLELSSEYFGRYCRNRLTQRLTKCQADLM